MTRVTITRAAAAVVVVNVVSRREINFLGFSSSSASTTVLQFHVLPLV